MPERFPALPVLPAPLRKNDALFLYGSTRELPFVMTYVENDVQVVHGPACTPTREIDLDRCARDNVAVRARRGGGGTVVLGPGMAIIVVVGTRLGDEPVTAIYERIHHAITDCVNEHTGLRLEPRGISDLAVGERKALGSSLYLARTRGLYFYQSSLLVDCDTTLFARYLMHPPREPAYRLGRSHDRFCAALCESGASMSAHHLAGCIGDYLPERLREYERGGDYAASDSRGAAK